MARFPHLHNHSYYSYEETPISIDEIISREKDLGSDIFTITDTDSPTAFAKGLMSARKSETKMIPGIELFVKPDKKYDKEHLRDLLARMKKVWSRKKIQEDDLHLLKSFEIDAEAGDKTEDYEHALDLAIAKIKDRLNDKIRLDTNQLKDADFPLSYDYYRLLIIAFNKPGLNNLMRLWSFDQGSETDPHHGTFEQLREFPSYHDDPIFNGIGIFTGFDGSKLNHLIQMGNLDKAKEEIQKYSETSETYLVLEGHNTNRDREINKILINLYKELNLPNVKLVAANNTFYATEDQQREQELYRAIFNDLAYNEWHKDHQEMMDEETMKVYLQEVDVPEEIIEESIQNATDFAEKVDKMAFPQGHLLQDYSKELRELAEKGLEKRFGKQSKLDQMILDEIEERKHLEKTGEIDDQEDSKTLDDADAEERSEKVPKTIDEAALEDRGIQEFQTQLTLDDVVWTEEDQKMYEMAERQMNHELETIEELGFTEYFVKVQAITSEIRRVGALKGTSRGSGGGSVVVYMLGINDTNPLQYNLIFERMLNKGRGNVIMKEKDGSPMLDYEGNQMYKFSYPDIDLDLASYIIK